MHLVINDDGTEILSHLDHNRSRLEQRAADVGGRILDIGTTTDLGLLGAVWITATEHSLGEVAKACLNRASEVTA